MSLDGPGKLVDSDGNRGRGLSRPLTARSRSQARGRSAVAVAPARSRSQGATAPTERTAAAHLLRFIEKPQAASRQDAHASGSSSASRGAGERKRMSTIRQGASNKEC